MIKVRNLGSIGKISQQRKTIEAALSNVNEEEVRKAASEQRAKMEDEKKQKADARSVTQKPILCGAIVVKDIMIVDVMGSLAV